MSVRVRLIDTHGLSNYLRMWYTDRSVLYQGKHQSQNQMLCLTHFVMTNYDAVGSHDAF